MPVAAFTRPVTSPSLPSPPSSGLREARQRFLPRAWEGARGRGAWLNLPIYKVVEVGEYLQAWAKAKRLEVGRLVNDLLRRELEIIESVK